MIEPGSAFYRSKLGDILGVVYTRRRPIDLNPKNLAPLNVALDLNLSRSSGQQPCLCLSTRQF